MVFIVYKDDVFREYYLPAIDNSDYKLTLDKNLFSLKADVTLFLESIEQKWYIRDSRDYSMRSDSVEFAHTELRGGEILTLKTSSGEKAQCIIADCVYSPCGFKKFDSTDFKYMTIGNNSSATVTYSFMNFVSKNHCAFFRENGRFIVEDTSSNGVFVNYKRINQRRELRFGDTVSIFGLNVVFLNNIIAIQTRYGDVTFNGGLMPYVFPEASGSAVIMRPVDYFNRAPRALSPITKEEIAVESPPPPSFTKKSSLFNTIGPAFTMALPMLLGCVLAIYGSGEGGNSAFMYTGLVSAVGSAALGALWAVLNLREQKRDEVKAEEKRFNLYGNYLMEISEHLKEAYAQNTNAMHAMYPPAETCSGFTQKSAALWNRNWAHDDFLFCRLGTGDVPFQVKIKLPDEKFSLESDQLRGKAKLLYENYKTLSGVPVGVDLREHLLWGVVGGKSKAGCFPIIDSLIAQIAANNCYTDVKLVFCFDEKSLSGNDRWEYVKWLPHLWDEGRKNRYFASGAEETGDVLFELSNIMRRRAENTDNSSDKRPPEPHCILFVFDATLLEGGLISKYVYDPKPEYGLTTVILTDYYERLPNACRNIIQNDRRFRGSYDTLGEQSDRQEIIFDSVRPDSMSVFSRNIANIHVRETGGDSDIPNTLDFFEMYGASSLDELRVQELWRKNRTYNTMRAPVGTKAGGAPCYLDIHEKYHGPHGLVAGTTGSGKSETLQTYMLSLAVGYSPDDVAFFVIDFKGGGMANLFSGLPHMAGQISNLSGNQIRRAMISIKSENLRRQRLFNECGVNNINAYTRLYKGGETSVSIPHLIIVIDEFAELKREEPEFMQELISVAQVGRSLGVHLILATQKPAGTVDDNIWSNSKFRLCLRVQDRQDSMDMLHRPDAAYLTQAGRCYFQVGNDEIFDLFQSGWSGAAYDSNMAENRSALALMITPNGKTALAGSYSKMRRRERERGRWYTALAQNALALKDTMGINEPLCDLDGVALTEFSVILSSTVREQGYDPGNREADLRAIKTFIQLMPQDITDAEECADHVVQAAAENGKTLPELKEKTQLEVIVDYLAKVAGESGYERSAQLWMPLLPEHLLLEELSGVLERLFNGSEWKNQPSGTRFHLETAVGLYDDPENQAQLPLTVNFSENGSLAVLGAVISGKSTFLQTLLYSLMSEYTPGHVCFYILDYSSGLLAPFAGYPHVGGVLNENDADQTGKLFNMLDKMLDERKKALGGGSFSQFVKANGWTLPVIMLVIDNFSNFKEKTENVYDDLLVRLSKEGAGLGIFLILSAAGFGMAEIQNRIADSLKSVVCLEMGDKFKYMDALSTTSIPVLPESGIKGRGLSRADGRLLEFQTALSCEADDDYRRGEKLRLEGERMCSAWSGKRAAPIPFIPENPLYNNLAALDDYIVLSESKNKIPYAYCAEDASVYSADMRNLYCFSITGKRRTGKTNALKLLIKGVLNKNGDMYVCETRSTELKLFANDNGVKYLSDDAELFSCLDSIKDVFIARNSVKRECATSGMSDAKIYAKMSEEKPVFFFIADLGSFLESVYNPKEGIGNMSGFLENIIEKGSLHNIYFFACVNTDDSSVAAGYALYQLFTGYRTGVHLGGNVSAQHIFNFQDIHYSELSKSYKKGVGLAPAPEDDTVSVKVIIPLLEGDLE